MDVVRMITGNEGLPWRRKHNSEVFAESLVMEDPDLGKFDFARLQAELDQEMEMK